MVIVYIKTTTQFVLLYIAISETILGEDKGKW